MKCQSQISMYKVFACHGRSQGTFNYAKTLVVESAWQSHSQIFGKLELNSLDSDNFCSDNHHQIRRSLLPIMTKPVVKT